MPKEEVAEAKESLICKVCGKDGYKNLVLHVRKAHGLTGEEYKEKYGLDSLLILPSHARFMAKLSNERWKDPKVRKKRAEGIRKSYTEELRQLRSETALRQHAEDSTKFGPRMRILREQAYRRAKSCCEECGISEKELREAGKHGLYLHHLTYDKIIPELDDLELLCASCHSKRHGPGSSGLRRKVTRAVTHLIASLGLDLTNENLVETPRRVASVLIELLGLSTSIEQSLEEFSDSVFSSDIDQMVIAKDIYTSALCPHHLMPVEYWVSIGYIPNGYVIGLSKLARLSSVCAKRPYLQEDFTQFLAEAIMEYLRPLGVGVVVKGKHSCIATRGPMEPNMFIRTSVLLGNFRKLRVREEFLLLVKDNE